MNWAHAHLCRDARIVINIGLAAYKLKFIYYKNLFIPLTNVHRAPDKTLAVKHKKNPMESKSTSPRTVKNSPAAMTPTTAKSVNVISSIPNIKAQANTKMGVDALIIV